MELDTNVSHVVVAVTSSHVTAAERCQATTALTHESVCNIHMHTLVT
jgi:hypothetical protein